MQTNQNFPPLRDCLRQLDILISDAGSNAVFLAERDIDAFAAHEPNLSARAGHLHVLQTELEKKWNGLEGKLRILLTLCLILSRSASGKGGNRDGCSRFE
jgi:hypothetical protein